MDHRPSFRIHGTKYLHIEVQEPILGVQNTVLSVWKIIGGMDIADNKMKNSDNYSSDGTVLKSSPGTDGQI